MPTCLHCSSPFPDGSQFCPSCGRRPSSSSSDLPTVDSGDPPASPGWRSPAVPRSNPSSRLSASGHGGFVPGAILAKRFRIVSLIGRGGMGEVYRADDLEIGQPVALKFISRTALADPGALERFRGEVRNARQITHPNVCRVYDIGEHEGRTFLSMEYVDGEDLASLLRRIGHLPATKANEIAQQICAGLSAAHAREILHRDLKPSNILIDGRGQAHVTDFGLATPSNQDVGETVGTPAYMAPEQFRGEPATARTDLYALGLVLYELYTGKRPFPDAPSFVAYKQQHLRDAPPAPRDKVPDLDPAVEAIILRCLEKDPVRRPASAVTVSTTLPGGNALAATLAAGETPSPEMVAASGEEGALSRGAAFLLSVAMVASLAVAIFFSGYANTVNLFPPGKSPDYLSDRARELASTLGEVPPPADYAWWFVEPFDVDSILGRIPAPRRYREVAAFFPSMLRFSYRQSPRLLESPSHHRLFSLEPAPYYSGEVSVTLDTQGGLLYFSKIPPQKSDAPAADLEPDWTSFWQASSISPETLKLIPALWTPDVAADRTFAWKGDRNGQPFEVYAASHLGKPVFFRVARPDELPSRMVEAQAPAGFRFAIVLFGVVGTLALLVCAYYAYRNLRSGRADLRGALRTAAVIYVVELVFYTLTSHHIFDVGYEWDWLQRTIGASAGIPLIVAVYYLAIEPFFRRTWPELLVSWTRLLSGRYRDPLVGRDIFIGTVLGVLHATLWQMLNASPYFFHVRGLTPNFAVSTLESFPAFLGDTLHTFVDAWINGIGAISIMFLAAKITRQKWVGAAVVCLLWASLNVPGFNYSLEVPAALLSGVVLAWTLSRLGLLATITLFFASFAVALVPFTVDLNRWYAARGILVLIIVVGVAFFGMRASLGSQSIVRHDD